MPKVRGGKEGWSHEVVRGRRDAWEKKQGGNSEVSVDDDVGGWVEVGGAGMMQTRMQTININTRRPQFSSLSSTSRSENAQSTNNEYDTMTNIMQGMLRVERETTETSLRHLK